MTNFSDLFTYTDETFSLTEAEEAQAIRDAQAGDETAKERLLLAYGRAMRAAVGGNYRLATTVNPKHGTSNLDPDDLEAAAALAVLEVIEDHDPDLNPRLAGRVSQRLARELADHATTGAGFAIPERTLSRYYGILREADGDSDLALEIAPDFSMTRETFRAVQAAVRPDSLDDRESGEFQETTAGRTDATYGAGWGESSLWGGGSESLADVEDAILVEAAFRAVDDEEARICELAYGFTEYEPVPDAEIAHRIGLTRPTVQRKRSGALGKMRKALGALEESDWKE